MGPSRSGGALGLFRSKRTPVRRPGESHFGQGRPTVRPLRSHPWALDSTDTLRIRVRSVMEVPEWYDLNREWSTLIPRKMDGSGAVVLWMKAGSAKRFGLDKFPRPECARAPYPGRKCTIRPTMGKLAGANQGSFRLAHSWPAGEKKPRMCRFRLSASWRVETMQVITNFLRENYDGWFEIRNCHGNNAWDRYFSSIALPGGGRSCT